jgi:protein involved in polysaccharide export with SLBB domain
LKERYARNLKGIEAMIKSGNVRGGLRAVGALIAAGLLLAGCHLGKDKEFSDVPGLTQPEPMSAGVQSEGQTASSGAGGASQANDSGDVLQPGQNIQVTFSDLSERMAPFDQIIREDGTITLAYNKSFHAAGKTTSQLEKEIHDAYVPGIYVRLTVTVAHTSSTRFYYVGGEVKAPGRQIWIGPISVTRAIQSAGDFTDFANKKKVRLTRVDGRTQTVNCMKALEHPEIDPQVFPGDKISVPRKLF